MTVVMRKRAVTNMIVHYVVHENSTLSFCSVPAWEPRRDYCLEVAGPVLDEEQPVTCIRCIAEGGYEVT